jgi:hypothetical protein
MLLFVRPLKQHKVPIATYINIKSIYVASKLCRFVEHAG